LRVGNPSWANPLLYEEIFDEILKKKLKSNPDYKEIKKEIQKL